ncbi:hypothetical protein TKK_0016729 [Trichogramma kaykai]|uniref:Synembryn-A n=1 Tax=Trichogramma kaykai TaxID=54128 RepID=A0ABD2W3Q7_9HYME
MVDLLHQLSSENEQVFSQALQKFVNDYADTMKLDFLNENDLRTKIWDALFILLLNKDQEFHRTTCLRALRILSRDKTDINKIITNDRLKKILYLSGLNEKCDEYIYNAVTQEAQKLLCNILFNCPDTLNMLRETKCLDVVFDRMKKYNKNVSHETKLFDMRIVFLATAINHDFRDYVQDQLRGDRLLIEVIDNISAETNEFKTIKMEDEKLICETLKTLFNLFMQSQFNDEDSDMHFQMVMCLRKLLTSNKGSSDDLDSNIVNLLLIIPHKFYSKLISINSDTQQNAIFVHDADMTIVQLLIDFLHIKLNIETNLAENLSPILSFFIKFCKAERLVRKYVRIQILPPLKDVKNRPEEGPTIRNKLCKLLTSPVTNVKDLAAEFLFVLCKEKVGRMIKYTGYGNAAGMFANKGLLGSDKMTVNYSSESENSDTEEYEQMKDQINPVLGCYEKPKPNPLENMTDEQKEYEAMKLVSLVDQLQRGGMIQPCRIGEDGKPVPIEHVLELKKELPKQQINSIHNNSDSE